MDEGPGVNGVTSGLVIGAALSQQRSETQYGQSAKDSFRGLAGSGVSHLQ